MHDIVQQLEERTVRLIHELETTRVQMRQSETEADGLRISVADRDRLESELNSARGRLAQTENDTILLRRERDSLLEERGRIPVLEAEIAGLREKIAEIDSAGHAALEQARAEAEVLRADLGSVRAAAEAASIQFTELTLELETKVADLSAARERIAELEARVVESGEAGAIIEQLRAENAAAAKTITDIKWHFGELESEAKRVTAQRDHLASEREAHIKHINDLRWKIGELEADIRRADEARLGHAERATVAERTAREAREWSAELESELAKVTTERDEAKALAASAGTANSEAVASAIAEAEERAESLRRENEDMRLRLNEFVARDQRTRERLDGLINRIDRAENLIEQTELAIHADA